MMHQWPENIWVQRRVPRFANYVKKYPDYRDHWDLMRIPVTNLNGYLNRKWLIVPDQVAPELIEQLHQDRLGKRTTKFGRFNRPVYEPPKRATQPYHTEIFDKKPVRLPENRPTQPHSQKLLNKGEIDDKDRSISTLERHGTEPTER